MTFADYLAQASRYYYAHKGQMRIGQSYFNVLVAKRPDISEKIRASGIDPFYKDEHVPSFLTHVAEAW